MKDADDWVLIAEAVEETGISADALLESFARCGVPVARLPLGSGKYAMLLPCVQRVAYERWKGIASWVPETRYRVSALPIRPPA